jgi:hypothetical protein
MACGSGRRLGSVHDINTYRVRDQRIRPRGTARRPTVRERTRREGHHQVYDQETTWNDMLPPLQPSPSGRGHIPMAFVWAPFPVNLP